MRTYHLFKFPFTKKISRFSGGFLLVYLVFLCSCSVTKRHYRKGFFIEGLPKQRVQQAPAKTESGVPTISLPEQNTVAEMPMKVVTVLHYNCNEAKKEQLLVSGFNQKLQSAAITEIANRTSDKSLVRPATKQKKIHYQKKKTRQSAGSKREIDFTFLLVFFSILIPPIIFCFFCPDYVPRLTLAIIWTSWIVLLLPILLFVTALWLIILLCVVLNLLCFFGGLVLTDLMG